MGGNQKEIKQTQERNGGFDMILGVKSHLVGSHRSGNYEWDHCGKRALRTRVGSELLVKQWKPLHIIAAHCDYD